MATVKDRDGQKRHVCDGDCQRICDHCVKPYKVHGMWRWGLQTFVRTRDGQQPDGDGGLLCKKCAPVVIAMLHSGEYSKFRMSDDEWNELLKLAKKARKEAKRRNDN